MGVVCEVRRRLLYVAVLVCSLFTSGIIGQTSWTGLDIGNPAIAGNSSGTASELSITAAGSDIGGTSDQFYFVYQQIVGDVDVRARVDGITYGSWLAVAGVMIRGSLAADAAHGFALVSRWTEPSSGAARRRVAGAPAPPGCPPRLLSGCGWCERAAVCRRTCSRTGRRGR